MSMTATATETEPEAELTAQSDLAQSELEQSDDDSGIQSRDSSSNSTPKADYGKKAYWVLFGSALVQLPVWGFQQAFGVFQEYETSQLPIAGDKSTVGIIGTTLIGVMYISMPFFSAFLARYPGLRAPAILLGGLLAALGLLASSYATETWHLLLTQGVLHALGAALLYTAAMLNLNTWFIQRKGLAIGITLSTKTAIGAATPFVATFMLEALGFRTTLLIWMGLVLGSTLPSALLVRPRRLPSSPAPRSPRAGHAVGWSFLRHRTAWVFISATTVFSAGYGLPQNYMPSYATQVLRLSHTLSSAMLAVFSASSIPASITFGLLCDGTLRLRGRRMGVAAATALSALGAALPVFFLWGFSAGSLGVLVAFNVLYGFFAGGFSATWSGVMKLVEAEGAANGEPVNTGVVFGLLNGGRGVGFVVGGLIGLQLLKQGAISDSEASSAYGTKYGAMILFSGITSVLGASGVLLRRRRTT